MVDGQTYWSHDLCSFYNKKQKYVNYSEMFPLQHNPVAMNTVKCYLFQ